jgi:YHS domain-containing protein
MAGLLLRLAAFIAGLWLVRRLLSLLLPRVGPRGRAASAAADGPPASARMVKDPVCGMYMDSRLAVQVSTRRGPVFFCSEDCRNRYDPGAP